jgi:hypothetical protein
VLYLREVHPISQGSNGRAGQSRTRALSGNALELANRQQELASLVPELSSTTLFGQTHIARLVDGFPLGISVGGFYWDGLAANATNDRG